jgi:hypothetical protein
MRLDAEQDGEDLGLSVDDGLLYDFRHLGELLAKQCAEQVVPRPRERAAERGQRGVLDAPGTRAVLEDAHCRDGHPGLIGEILLSDAALGHPSVEGHRDGLPVLVSRRNLPPPTV